MRVPITRPCVDQSEIDAIAVPLRSGWLGQGKQVRAFEARVASHVGASQAVACSSCTAGLHMALASLGIGPDDEVVVPSFTWIATANAVESCGARPVFCDVDLATFNIDVAGLDGCITPRTRAIVPVHQFGLPADLEPLLEIAAQHRVAVVEDAACALGSRYRGRHAGTLGDIGVFSFHPRKVITTGEGGMAVTGDTELARLMRSLRSHGTDAVAGEADTAPAPGRVGDFPRLGFNYRMTDLQAAVGVAQMDKLEWILQRRGELAGRYDQLLGDLPWLRTPQTPAGLTHSFQAYVCLYCPCPPTLDRLEELTEQRNLLMRLLHQQGVQVRQGTHAVHLTGRYRQTHGLEPAALPAALLADGLSLALPLFPQMTPEQQTYVATQLRRAFEQICVV